MKEKTWQLARNEVITASGLRISMPMPRVLRVTDGNHKGSYMVSRPLRRMKAAEDGSRVVWGNVEVEPEDLLSVYFGGKLISRDFAGCRRLDPSVSAEELAQLLQEGHITDEDLAENQGAAVEVIKCLPEDAVVYGLGDKTGFLNKRHYAYKNWNTDNPDPHCDNYQSLYKSINFFMVYSQAGCVGYLADNTHSSWFDFGKESGEYLLWTHDGGALDYYMILGKTPKEVLITYYDLTGRNELQQKWVYGFHQSRWSYYTDAEVLSIAKTMREQKLPIDSIHMDIDYMDGFRVFTFDPQRFSDPKALFRKLDRENIKPITIIDPGVKLDPGYFLYDEGMQQGHFAKNPDGAIYEGAVWPGPSVFPDFTQEKTRKWWGDQLALLTDAGVRGIWNDMNEPANFTGPLPDDVQFSAGDHREVHNIYGHLMAQATYEGLRRADCRRPFVLTRACCAGSQRYCSGWTGDNHSMWQHLQLSLTQMMNLGLSGMNMVGSDVGGFGSDVTPELLIRWSQLGAISPFFRNHSAKGTMRQEFYALGQEVTDACRKSLDLRYHLLPYIYDLAHQELPILRPLVLEFPQDPICRELTDQCMLGDSLLCAPVMTPGVKARAVYLPKGTWYDYYTGRKFRGGQYVLAEAPLDRMPIFAKAGSSIPVSVGKPQCVEDITEVELEAFPGRGSHIHYMDDGETLEYAQGALRKLKITVNGHSIHQKVIQDGYAGPDCLPCRWKA